MRLAAAMGSLALIATPTMAEEIAIANAGFEDVSNFCCRGNWHDMDDWIQEDEGTVYVDDNGTGWVPEASRTLYFGPGAVHQDLDHNWSASDVYTLGLIAMNPTWSDDNNTFKVQLRQASDDTVLWDSGDQNVGGTVTAGPAYSGTGHLFSWAIDAGTFTAGTAGEQINIRIVHVSGGPVYADNVSLEVSGASAPFAITEIDYDSNANSVTLTWRKTGAASYIAKHSVDMTGWGADLADGIDADDDENPGDSEHITVTFPLTDGLENAPDLFFRIEEEPPI